jgi:hypothetical protein
MYKNDLIVIENANFFCIYSYIGYKILVIYDTCITNNHI